MLKSIGIVLFFAMAVFAKCEPASDYDTTKMEALQLYKDAEGQYDSREFAQAYETLKESYGLYTTEEKILTVRERCTKLVAGPFAPIRTPYTEDQDYSFDRYTLGTNIKAFLAPKPLVVIQFIENSNKVIPEIKKDNNLRTLATVVNLSHTKRESIEKQLSLENFSVEVNGNKLEYSSDIESGQQATKTFSRGMSYKNISVDSNERFGFKTFSKDW